MWQHSIIRLSPYCGLICTDTCTMRSCVRVFNGSRRAGKHSKTAEAAASAPTVTNRIRYIRTHTHSNPYHSAGSLYFEEAWVFEQLGTFVLKKRQFHQPRSTCQAFTLALNQMVETYTKWKTLRKPAPAHRTVYFIYKTFFSFVFFSVLFCVISIGTNNNNRKARPRKMLYSME